MPYAYSEDKFIESTAIGIFKEMNWQTANVYKGEKSVQFSKPTAESGAGYVVAEVDEWGFGGVRLTIPKQKNWVFFS